MLIPDALIPATSAVFAGLVEHPPAGSVPLRIAPPLAQEILANAFRATGDLQQRPLRQGRVKLLADRMAQPQGWHHPAEPILITGPDNTGQNGGMVANGQHRLSAVVLVAKPVLFDVRFGVDPETIAVVDESSRTLADYFTVRGVQNAKVLAASIKFVYRYLDGDWSDTPSPMPDKPGSYAYLLAHQRLGQSAWVASAFAKRDPDIAPIAPTVAMGFHYLAAQIDAGAADDFIRRIYNGVGLVRPREPARLLRNMLSNLAERKRMAEISRSDCIDKSVQFALLVYGWNTFRGAERWTTAAALEACAAVGRLA
jgi:hypothetical protein